MVQHNQTVFAIEGLQPDWLPKRGQRWLPTLGAALVSGLVGGLGFGLGGGLRFDPIFGLIRGLAFGLAFGLLGALGGVRGHAATKIVSMERLRWSWANMRFGRSSLIFGLVCGLLFGLLFRLTGRLIGAVLGVFMGVALSGFGVTDTVEVRSVPNQGIWTSLRTALIVASVGGLLGGLVGGLAGLLGGGMPGARIIGLGGAFMLGLGCVLLYGGRTFLQHFFLRWLLASNGLAPWNYVAFLNSVVERMLLRQVGGGYIFIHRLLLEYFAILESHPASSETSESNSTTLA